MNLSAKRRLLQLTSGSAVLFLLMILSVMSVFAVSSITVTSPNGGEKWAGTKNITWSFTGTSSVGFKVALLTITSNGTIQTDIQNIVPEVTGYTWSTTPYDDGANYKISVADRDIDSSSSDSSESTFTIDNTAPLLSTPTVGYPSPFTFANNSAVLTITVTASDTPGGIDLVVLNASSLGGSSAVTMFDDGTNGDAVADDTVYTAQVTVTGQSSDANKTIFVKATDGAGNQNNAQAIVQIDVTNPSSNADTLSSYQTASLFSIPFTATDSTSGISTVQLYYSKDGSAFTLYGASSSSPISFNSTTTGGDGAYGFYTVAIDNAGNIEIAPAGNDTATFVDSLAPTTTDDAPTGWQNSSPINITLTPDDPSPSSGIVWTRYCTDQADTCTPAAGQDYSGAVSISAQNITYFRYASNDSAGNVQSTVSKTIQIDTVPPASSADALTATQFESVFLIPFTATDAVSGVSSVDLYYSKDGSAFTLYGASSSSPISFNSTTTGGDGAYGFYTVAIDNAGNIEIALAGNDTATFVDSLAPTTTDNAPTGWQNSSPINITLTPDDPSPSSGIVWTRYCTDQADTCTPAAGQDYSGAVSISAQNITYFRYASNDSAGNVQSTVSKTIQIDTVPPASSADALAQYQTSSIFDINFTATDTTSGVVAVRLFYRINTGTWTDYGFAFTSSPVNFNATVTGGDGFYEFYTIANDSAGNIEPAPAANDTFTTVDTAFPEIINYTLNVSGAQPTTANNVIFSPNSDGIQETVSIDLEFSETVDYSIKIKNASGALAQTIITSRAKNPTAKTWTGTGNSGDGAYTIEINLNDDAGNAIINTTKTITLDTTNPTVGSVSVAPSFGTNPLYISAQSNISASVSDSLSGVVSCAYTLDNGTTWVSANFAAGICSAADIPTENATAINIRATDSAGNAGYGEALSVAVDTVTSAQITSASDGLTTITLLNGSLFLIDADTQINVTVNETGAGVLSAQLYYTTDGTTPTLTSSLLTLSTSDSGTLLRYTATLLAADISDGNTVKFIAVVIDNLGNTVTTPVSSFMVDGAPPMITPLNGSMLVAVGSSPRIEAIITDTASGVDDATVILQSNITGPLTMQPVSGTTTYAATLPNQTGVRDISYTITAIDHLQNNATTSAFTIAVRDIVMTLNDSEWNLISVPKTLRNATKTAVFGDTDVWEYNSSVSTWVSPQKINPGYGYWVRNQENVGLNFATNFSAPGGQFSFDQTAVQLSAGWNLLGHLCTSEQPVDTAFPNSVYHHLFVLRYNDLTNRFEIYSTQSNTKEFTTMKPGEGYWTFLPSGNLLYTNVC